MQDLPRLPTGNLQDAQSLALGIGGLAGGQFLVQRSQRRGGNPGASAGGVDVADLGKRKRLHVGDGHVCRSGERQIDVSGAEITSDSGMSTW